jgi:hypothetical protein
MLFGKSGFCLVWALWAFPLFVLFTPRSSMSRHTIAGLQKALAHYRSAFVLSGKRVAIQRQRAEHYAQAYNLNEARLEEKLEMAGVKRSGVNHSDAAAIGAVVGFVTGATTFMTCAVMFAKI